MIKRYNEFILEYNIKDDPRLNNQVAIGDLIIPTHKDLMDIVNSDKAYNVRQIYGERAGGHTGAFLDRLDELYYHGGKVYRVVFLDNLDNLRTDNPGKNWTLFKDGIKGYIWNLHGEYEAGFMETGFGDIPFEQLQFAILTGRIEPKSFDPVRTFNQFLEFPEENEIRLTDQSMVKVIDVEEKTWDELIK